MSLRLRLVISIGVALTLLWSASAIWLWRDVSQDLQNMLDDRLAMSANMVAGLLKRQLAFESSSGGRDFSNALLSVPASQGMACQVRSMRGDVIAATDGAPAQLGGTMAAPGFHTQVVDGNVWRTYTLQASGVSITTADRMSGRDLLRRQIALTVGMPFLIAAVGGLLLLWLGTTRGLRPLRRLRRELAQRSPDALDPLATTRLPLELKPLIETLNQLLGRTQHAMQRERHFTNDAAHELRTPLTAISTHLQVARMTSGSTAETALADAAAGVARMQSTLEQLLLLARVEGRLPFDERDSIDAATTVVRAIADCNDAGASRIIKTVRDGEARLAVASALAVVALRNLIDNALRYAPADSMVTVAATSDETSVCFRVSDQGPGLPPAEAAQATQRFWRSGRQHGSGLGLTIVAAIAERYGGSLELSNLEPGLEVCLRLPRADV
ncbi:MAG TPA: ATP-binding protein [Salinisphaeraceae bacterium]|nr:ATP-binding protein [Salinisphaeraceae bacterium]